MCLIVKNLNKGYLAPLADRVATEQLYSLILNCPYVILINNYRSNSNNLDILRTLAKQSNGFAYQPNKNIKIRTFKRLSTALSLDIMGGLVVFIFFKDHANARSFLDNYRLGGYEMLTYSSMLISGHVVSYSTLLFDQLRFPPFPTFISLPFYNLNKSFIQPINYLVYSFINQLIFTLYAYIKSANKGN